VLLSEKADAVDHLLGSRPRRLEAGGEARVLALEELHAFWRGNALHSGHLETLETRFGLQRAPPKVGELVAKVFDQLLELGKRRSLRSYAV